MVTPEPRPTGGEKPDIVERCRQIGTDMKYVYGGELERVLHEAAAEITRLRELRRVDECNLVPHEDGSVTTGCCGAVVAGAVMTPIPSPEEASPVGEADDFWLRVTRFAYYAGARSVTDWDNADIPWDELSPKSKARWREAVAEFAESIAPTPTGPETPDHDEGCVFHDFDGLTDPQPLHCTCGPETPEDG